jgi:hypothetical protein
MKPFLGESGGELVQSAIAADPVAWTSAIAYLEARAGFARALREARITGHHYYRVRAEFERAWNSYSDVTADMDLIRQAAQLADGHTQHSLRAIDGLHLASALRVAAGEPHAVTVICFDRRLWRSARDEGFALVPSREP